MQEFWIETCFLTEDVKAETPAIKIYIPTNCPHCNFQIKIADVGCAEYSSSLIDFCSHTRQYSQLWNIRIQPNHDPLNDGCKCEKCSEWVPMAYPNLPNNKFKCYRCRTHPLSI